MLLSNRAVSFDLLWLCLYFKATELIPYWGYTGIGCHQRIVCAADAVTRDLFAIAKFLVISVIHKKIWSKPVNLYCTPSRKHRPATHASDALPFFLRWRWSPFNYPSATLRLICETTYTGL